MKEDVPGQEYALRLDIDSIPPNFTKIYDGMSQHAFQYISNILERNV